MLCFSAPWTHSGITGQVEVVSGRIFLKDSETEDVSASVGTNTVASAAVIYTSLIVNFAELPSGDGGYFCHFQKTSTRQRIFATTNGASPGFFRVGVANGNNSPTAIVDMDLSPNTDYAFVIRYVVSTAVSTLWVNPATELDVGATAVDVVSPVSITFIAFRQSLVMGALFVDNLVVGKEEITSPELGRRLSAKEDTRRRI